MSAPCVQCHTATHPGEPCDCPCTTCTAAQAYGRAVQYAEAIHAEAAYDGHSAGLPHDMAACGMAH